MIGRFIAKHLRGNAMEADFQGAAWKNLPTNYPDGPRELQISQRRSAQQSDRLQMQMHTRHIC